MDSKWYKQYCHNIVNNVVNRDGAARFTYRQLRTSLNVLYKHGDNIDLEVKKLFINCVNLTNDQVGTIEIDSVLERTLCLLLLNINMGYLLVQPGFIADVVATDVKLPGEYNYDESTEKQGE